MKSVAVLLALFAVCWAQEAPKPCCTPTQWEGGMSEFSGYNARRYHKEGLVYVGAKISYDGKAKKVASTAVVNQRPPVKIILDFSSSKMYLIKGGNCTVHKTKRAFRPACVPKTAKFGASFYQGAGAAKINENAWMIEHKGIHAIASVTQTGCIPIGEIAFGNMRGVHFMTNIGFANITPGIKDPNVFKPPASCKGVEEEGHDFGEDYPLLEYIRLKHTE